MYVIYNEDGTVFKIIYETGVSIDIYMEVNNYNDKYYEYMDDVSGIEVYSPPERDGVSLQDRMEELENVIDILIGGVDDGI